MQEERDALPERVLLPFRMLRLFYRAAALSARVVGAPGMIVRGGISACLRVPGVRVFLTGQVRRDAKYDRAVLIWSSRIRGLCGKGMLHGRSHVHHVGVGLLSLHEVLLQVRGIHEVSRVEDKGIIVCKIRIGHGPHRVRLRLRLPLRLRRVRRREGEGIIPM